jgi:hypothetical protein
MGSWTPCVCEPICLAYPCYTVANILTQVVSRNWHQRTRNLDKVHEKVNYLSYLMKDHAVKKNV